MKKSICIYGSLVAALLANAAELTRDEINRKLAELAKSDTPQGLGPFVSCYDMGSPLMKRREFFCSKCRERTIYNVWEQRSALDLAIELQNSLKELRELSSNIELDNTLFCSRCNPDKRLFQQQLYFKGPLGEQEYSFRGFPGNLKVKLTEDIKIRVILYGDMNQWLLFPEFWAEAKYGEPDSLESWEKRYDIRTGPGKEYRKVGELGGVTFHYGHELPKETRNGWILVGALDCIPIPENAKLPLLPHPQWVITVGNKTHRVPAKDCDDRLLIAFLSGKDTYKDGRDTVESVKWNQGRLQEILLNQPPEPKK